MGLGRRGDPGPRVMHKPMKYVEKHALNRFLSAVRCRTRRNAGSDIARLFARCQLPGHFRQIPHCDSGYISRSRLRV
jgi:hypothetical protein